MSIVAKKPAVPNDTDTTSESWGSPQSFDDDYYAWQSQFEDDDDVDYHDYPECDRCQDEGHPRGCWSCGRVTERDPVAEAEAAEDRKIKKGERL